MGNCQCSNSCVQRQQVDQPVTANYDSVATNVSKTAIKVDTNASMNEKGLPNEFINNIKDLSNTTKLTAKSNKGRRSQFRLLYNPSNFNVKLPILDELLVWGYFEANNMNPLHLADIVLQYYTSIGMIARAKREWTQKMILLNKPFNTKKKKIRHENTKKQQLTIKLMENKCENHKFGNGTSGYDIQLGIIGIRKTGKNCSKKQFGKVDWKKFCHLVFESDSVDLTFFTIFRDYPLQSNGFNSKTMNCHFISFTKHATGDQMYYDMTVNQTRKFMSETWDARYCLNFGDVLGITVENDVDITCWWLLQSRHTT